MPTSPSNDPNQWFDEDEDADSDFQPPKSPADSGDSSGSSDSEAEDSDGDTSDPEAELSPSELAGLVREAASLPVGKRTLPCKGKMYTLSPPGQGKKPMRPVFSGSIPDACEQLRELFFTGGRRYFRPLLEGTTVRFNVVSVKTIRTVITNMLEELPEDDRDIRVFCQQYTSEDVFKHLLGMGRQPSPPRKSRRPRQSGGSEGAGETSKKRKPETPAAAAAAVPAGPAAARQEARQGRVGAATLDKAVVVDSPVREAVPAKATAKAPAKAPAKALAKRRPRRPRKPLLWLRFAMPHRRRRRHRLPP